MGKFDKYEKYFLLRPIALIIAYITLGVVVFHILEDFGWIDSLYFVVVSLATVGYGDFVPQTQAGRLFAVFYIIIGLTVVAFFVRTVLKIRFSRRVQAFKKRRAKKKSKIAK